MTEDHTMWHFRMWQIPCRMRAGMLRWTELGILPGDFLTAIFENDLVEAVSRADDENMLNLPAYANFLYNHAPRRCWGGKAQMEAWQQHKKEQRAAGPYKTGGAF